MTAPLADITVIICTRNRVDSLRETLGCLARARRPGLHCEIVIVDNGGNDATRDLARTPIPGLPVHYLFEPRPGKCHAANRALAEAPLGAVVAFLDDDMSPEPGWFEGINAICQRWPDKDLFTGRTYIVWPDAPIPEWCRHPRLRGWAYSVMDETDEAALAPGRWFSGNHFWVRSRVLLSGRRFATGDDDIQIYLSEPQFMLCLAEDGYGGIRAADAASGHRIQPGLLDLASMKKRAWRVGRGYAVARLMPYKRKVKQAHLFRAHPVLSRLFCVASLTGWSLGYALACLHPVRSERIARQLHSIQRLATYLEYLRVAARVDDYRIFNRRTS